MEQDIVGSDDSDKGPDSNLTCYLQVTETVHVIVDCEDLARLQKYKWRTSKDQYGNLVIQTSYKRTTDQGQRWSTIRLGALILGPLPGKMVRTITNGAIPDYRKANLRYWTMSDRQRNLEKRRTKATSIYRGVCFDKKARQWRATIYHNKKSIFLGHFASERDAAIAYNAAAEKHFGALARLNQIDPGNFKTPEKG